MIRKYELDAFLEDSGQRTPFHLRISAPEKTKGEDDYFCRVHAPVLFTDDKQIFGVDEDQARELALRFVAAGATHLTLGVMPEAGVQGLLDIAREVGEPVRDATGTA